MQDETASPTTARPLPLLPVLAFAGIMTLMVVHLAMITSDARGDTRGHSETWSGYGEPSELVIWPGGDRGRPPSQIQCAAGPTAHGERKELQRQF